MNRLEFIKDFVEIKESKTQDFEICYVDFFNGITGSNNFGSLSVLSYKNKTTKPIDELEIRKDFLQTVKELAKKKFNFTKEKTFTFNDDVLSLPQVNRILISKIMNSSNLIAMEGRIGPGNCIVVSEENYHLFDLKSLSNYKFYFAPINDIIVYRNTEFDQPGLKLVLCDDLYALVQIGLNPENQFSLIKLDVRKKKLERILNK